MVTSKTSQKLRSAPAGDSEKGIQNGDSKSEEFYVSSSRKELFFFDRTNCDMKWQRANMVVGALVVKSNPYLQPKEDLKPMYKNDEGASKEIFEEALQAWQDFNLRKSFSTACVDVTASDCCCGFTQNDNEATIRNYVSLLNDGWVKYANSKLKTRGFKIDTFLWSWQNLAGKATSNILLIRFFVLSTYNFRRASKAGSLDLDAMLQHSDANGAEDESSQCSA